MTLKKNKRSSPSSRNPRRSKSNSKGIFIKDNTQSLLIPQGELDLFHRMVDQIGDEVMVIDKQARIVFVNDAVSKGLGYTKKNILYRAVTDFRQDKMSARSWQKKYFLEIKKRKKPISYIVDRIKKGGKVRTLEVTGVFMPYKSKDYVLTVGRDITERLAFESKLKEIEDRYRLLSEQETDGIMLIDTKGRTLYANKAASLMFKVPASSLVGNHFETQVDKASLSKAWKYFRKVKGGTPITHGELEIRDKKGKVIPTEFTASPIFRNSKVAQIHVIFRDISQKREMESLIRESEKMEAFQDFIAGTTHEIQQPLKGLLAHSQNLINKYKDRNFEYIGYKEFKDIMKTLQTMSDQVKYCFDTTDRLNSFNRRKAKLEKDHCHPGQVVRKAVNTLKHSFDVSDIKVMLRLDPKLPQALISEFDLSQALNNVLTNAVQSLPGGGGKIQIKTTYQKDQETISIVCQDDGVGIPDEVLTRVFDPFFTTKPRGLEKNSGLGLYIVYSIVKAHHGDVFIKSDFRKGTFVTIILPIYKPKKRKRSK